MQYYINNIFYFICTGVRLYSPKKWQRSSLLLISLFPKMIKERYCTGTVKLVNYFLFNQLYINMLLHFVNTGSYHVTVIVFYWKDTWPSYDGPHKRSILEQLNIRAVLTGVLSDVEVSPIYHQSLILFMISKRQSQWPKLTKHISFGPFY